MGVFLRDLFNDGGSVYLRRNNDVMPVTHSLFVYLFFTFVFFKKTRLAFEFGSRLKARTVRVTSSKRSRDPQDGSPPHPFAACKPFTRGVPFLPS